MIVCRTHPKQIKNKFLLISEYLFNPKKDYIKIFENGFKKYVRVRYSVSASSERLALYTVCQILGLQKGDEVILSSYNCLIIPNVLISLGLKPVFVDVLPMTHTINYRLIRKKITKKTKLIIATHIEGQPCEMDKLIKIAKAHKLYLIEDCAHSLGAEYNGKKVGSLGDVGLFSFGFGKHINTFGGGMITTNNKKIAKKIRHYNKEYDNHGAIFLLKQICKSFFYDMLSNKLLYVLFFFPFIYLAGMFFLDPIFLLFDDKKQIMNQFKEKKLKYSSLQALIGLSQLQVIDKEIKSRKEMALFFSSNLRKGIRYQKETNSSSNSRLNFAVLFPRRKKQIKNLLMKGIDIQRTWIHSCSSLYIFKQYRSYCPISDKLEKEIAYLPTYNISKKEGGYIVKVLNKLK